MVVLGQSWSLACERLLPSAELQPRFNGLRASRPTDKQICFPFVSLHYLLGSKVEGLWSSAAKHR